jgi:hypothetical protein
MQISDPKPLVDLVSALAGNFDTNHWITGVHNRADNTFDRIGQRRHALANRATEMILDGDATYFSEALVYL